MKLGSSGEYEIKAIKSRKPNNNISHKYKWIDGDKLVDDYMGIYFTTSSYIL